MLLCRVYARGASGSAVISPHMMMTNNQVRYARPSVGLACGTHTCTCCSIREHKKQAACTPPSPMDSQGSLGLMYILGEPREPSEGVTGVLPARRPLDE